MARESAKRLLPPRGSRYSLDLSGPGSATFNTVLSAVPGLHEHEITFASVGDEVGAYGRGTLTFTGNPTHTQASLDLDTVTGDLDTIVQAVDPGLAGNSITITVVGDSGAAEGVTIDEVGTAVTIHFEDGVSTVDDVETAIGTATLIEVGTGGTGATVLDAATDECTDEPLAGGTTETVTIGDRVYTFKDTLASAFDVLIGASASATLDNLIAAINAAAGEGTTYGTGTTGHEYVTAAAGAGDTMDVVADAVGTAGNLATTSVLAAGSWGAATMTGGLAGNVVTIAVAGSAITLHFSPDEATVGAFEAALRAHPVAGGLVYTSTAGTAANVLAATTDEFSATALTLAGSTTAAAPTATDGTLGLAAPFYSDEALVTVRSSAGSGTMTAIVNIWGWSEANERWNLIGSLNGGDAIPEATADYISYSELLLGIGEFSRFAAELGTLGGTGTALFVYMDFVRPGANS